MRLVFTDTLYEDADTYRFGIEGAANIFGRRLNWVPRAEDFPDYRVSEDVPLSQYRGNPEWRAFLAELRDRAAIAIPELVWLVDGRDIWEVFRDERFLLNSQRDPCSKILKRRKMNEWLASSCDPALDVIVYGIGEHERHRFDDGEGRGIFHRLAANGWNAEAPLIGKPEINPTLHMRAKVSSRLASMAWAIFTTIAVAAVGRVATRTGSIGSGFSPTALLTTSSWSERCGITSAKAPF
jgi:hypothetical protein